MIMPVDSKTTTSWEHTYTTTNGITLRISGREGGDSVHISIREPDTGYGLTEYPGSIAALSMTCADWSNLINLVGIK